MIKMPFLLQNNLNDINCGHVRKCVMRSIIFWTICLLDFGVKAKENQDKVPTLYWLPKLHKTPIKQGLLLILVLVRQQNFLNC